MATGRACILISCAPKWDFPVEFSFFVAWPKLYELSPSWPLMQFLFDSITVSILQSRLGRNTILMAILSDIFFLCWKVWRWVFYLVLLWWFRYPLNSGSLFSICRHAKGVYLWAMVCSFKHPKKSKMHNWSRLSKTRSLVCPSQSLEFLF